MPAKARTFTEVSKQTFPSGEVERRLRDELQQAEKESAVLRGGWGPALDSLVLVSAVLSLEKLCSFRLPLEKMVRRGGYASVEEGVTDMSERLRRLWNERNQPEVRS